MSEMWKKGKITFACIFVFKYIHPQSIGTHVSLYARETHAFVLYSLWIFPLYFAFWNTLFSKSWLVLLMTLHSSDFR